MRSLQILSAWTVGAALFAFAPPAALAANPVDPARLLSETGQASGGVHWQKVLAIVAEGSLRQEGMNCSVHTVTDLRNGYWKQRTHCPAFSTAQGIDANGAWKQDRSGQVHSLNSPEAKTLAATDRWLNRRGPLSPKRLPAALKTLAPATASGVTYARIAATPRGGRTVTLWIDRKDHRLSKIVMLRSFLTVATEFGDYRNVNGLRLPFRITTATGRPPNVTTGTETITRYKLRSSLPARALERPSDAVTDVQLPHGRTQVPLSLSPGGKLLVEARLDGKGPFPFVLDTGGHFIITPAVAERLGLDLTGQGASRGAGAGMNSLAFARVHSLRLGAAKIADQSVLVMHLSPIMTDLGNKPPVAGILGLEIFARFAVTVDLAHHELILQSFAKAEPPRDAMALPICFTDDMPLMNATLDGKAGIFGVDTGNSGPLLLFPDWAERNGLASYYEAGLPKSNGGQGGMFVAHAAYIHSLRLGKLTVPGPLIGQLTPKGVGATSNPSEAGNLGMTVWRNYRVSFNYRKDLMYLTPRPHYAAPRIRASGGFAAVKLSHDAFTVVRIAPNGAATKAGLKKGDKITAVNGVAASALASLYLVEHIAHAKPGSQLKLTLSDGRHVTVVLTGNAAMEKALHPPVP